MTAEFLRHSLMLMFLGTAGLLLAVQSLVSTNSDPAATRSGNSAANRLSLTQSPRSPKLAAPNPEIRLVVSLGARRLEVYRNNQLQASYPLAVGKQGWETPTGTYQVMQRFRNPVWQHPITGQIVPPGPDNPLGGWWIGFWTDGKHQIGFHGTNEEDLIGQAVSHGCLRMRNQDIAAVFSQVGDGTPVIVKP